MKPVLKNYYFNLNCPLPIIRWYAADGQTVLDVCERMGNIYIDPPKELGTVEFGSGHLVRERFSLDRLRNRPSLEDPNQVKWIVNGQVFNALDGTILERHVVTPYWPSVVKETKTRKILGFRTFQCH